MVDDLSPRQAGAGLSKRTTTEPLSLLALGDVLCAPSGDDGTDKMNAHRRLTGVVLFLSGVLDEPSIQRITWSIIIKLHSSQRLRAETR